MVFPVCAAVGAIADCAESQPNALALIEPNGLTLNYAELWTQLTAVGHRLEEAGIGSRDTVCILLPQGIHQVLAVAGILNYCICAPLQPRTTVSEVEAALRKLAAAALIVSPEFEAEAHSALGSGLTVMVARHDQSPRDWEIRRPLVSRNPSARNSDAVLLLLTSATTSSSKLVPLSAANLDAGAVARRDSLRLTASDRMLLMTSLSHSIGVGTTLAQFLAKGSIIATRGFDPASYLRWLHDLQPTWYDCAPTVHQAALVELTRTPPSTPVSLRFIQSAGAPLPDDVRKGLEQLLRIPVFNDYGMTEACAIATDALLSGGRVPNSLGGNFGMEIGVMHECGDLLPPGEEGEIVVRGPAVFSGYEDDADANRRAFQGDWFRTGDQGLLDEDGNLSITGRLKEMINRGGEKILPGEVDAAILSHPMVVEAAAFAVPHRTLGEDVACAVVLRDVSKAGVTAHELRRFAAQRLAAFKVPHHIYFVDEIPRGELGKPQRWVLSDRFRERRAAPPSAAEVIQHLHKDGIFFEVLHEIWARILERDDLGFNEDFFEAGGDSLAAVNMLAEIDQRFGCETSAWAASFLDEPTLENLVVLVGNPAPPRPNPGDPSDIRIFPVRKSGASEELFCLPAEGHEGLYFRRLATHLAGKMDLSIVRPANTFHSMGLFSIEREGIEVAEVIRRAQPDGPYFVSGYCYGGVIAAEAARQLALEGQDVRVILFEVPMPGSPGILRDWPAWIKCAKLQWRRIWTMKHPGLTRNVRRFLLRVLWAALVPLRRLLLPIEHFAPIQWLLKQAEYENFPLYKARVADAPFLHFLCTDEPSPIDSASRFAWRRIAGRGIEERFVPLNHQTVLLEPNLPEIVEVLLRWCGIQENHRRETKNIIDDLVSMNNNGRA